MKCIIAIILYENGKGRKETRVFEGGKGMQMIHNFLASKY